MKQDAMYFISDRHMKWLNGGKVTVVEPDYIMEAAKDYLRSRNKAAFKECPEAGNISDYIGLDDIAESFNITVDQLIKYCNRKKPGMFKEV